MSLYGNGFHITALFVTEFHNILVDSPHRGPVMQIFSVSFVVSLNKLLNQQFSCWWFERLCHCKVTHLCHIMILLQNIFVLLFCISFCLNTHTCYKTYFFVFNQFSPRLQQLLYFCPACRTTLIATRFRVAVICSIIQVPHCIRVFFYFVWFVFINHIFQFYNELCTYCNILDIYLLWNLNFVNCVLFYMKLLNYLFLACLEVSGRVVS